MATGPLFDRDCVNNYINTIAGIKNNPSITNENERTQYIVQQMQNINQYCAIAGGSEGFANPSPSYAPVSSNNSSTTYLTISGVIYFIIGLYCIYLSWSCNSGLNINTVLKVIYALLAAFFNIFYLIYYFAFRLGTCNK